MTAKQLLNGGTRNIMLVVITAMVGYMIWTIEDMKQDVKQNTRSSTECNESMKYFKEKVIQHEVELYNHGISIQQNREDVLRLKYQFDPQTRGIDPQKNVTGSKKESENLLPAYKP